MKRQKNLPFHLLYINLCRFAIILILTFAEKRTILNLIKYISRLVRGKEIK